MKPLLARELLSTLRRSELQAVCSSLVDGKSLRKLSKTKLLPTLSAILTTVPTKSPQKKRLKQTTLSGLSPAQCLANAVLKTVGHSLRIPDHVLLSLKRIHFLFFLEDGHLSPNLILADTGKVKFPTYLCRPMTAVFPSSFAFEQYEKAIELEEQLDSALEEKRFEDAASLGSIAELELRQFFNPTSQLESSQHTLQSPPSASQSPDSSFDSDDELRDCQTTPQMKAVYDAEAKVQLKHPFFRRYTAQWVYVRACAHSVQALERLSEFETAVTRLKLLLSTQLMPKRRGKCLNRLTINMFKHLALLQEPLDIIVAALLSKDHLLRHGDRNGLAKRGIAIDKKMGAAAKTGKEKTGGVRKKVARRSKSSPAEDRASCPAILLKTLERVPVKVNVRKVYGKSLNVQSREEHVKREERLQRDDPWKRLLADNSRDSFMSSSSQGSRLSIMGKSKFCSFRSGGGAVSVEEYCLEWYFAKQKWCGSHDEGKSVRFLFALFLWECALFAPVSDVFQTPYQDRPLDLFTEAFYGSRKEAIDKRLVFIASMTACDLFEETVKLYEMFEDTRAIGCVWNVYSAKELATVSAGLGGAVLSHCFKLLAEDYAYWGAGLPDLTLWRMDENDDRPVYYAKLVEVKSARDNLSERQRAWLVELSTKGGACEVCKVVEKLTAQNSGELEEAQLDSVAISALDKYLSSSKD